MAITVPAQVTGTPASNPTSGGLTIAGTGWAAGDLAIWVWYSRAYTKTFTKPSGVTVLRDVAATSATGGGHLYIGYRVMQSGDGDSTFNWSNGLSVSNGTTGWFVVFFRGVSLSAAFHKDATPVNGTSSQDPDPPSVTPTVSGTCAVTVYGQMDDNDGTFTDPSGYSSGANWSSTSGTDAASGLSYKTNLTADQAEDPGTYNTNSGSNYWWTWTGALAPAQIIAPTGLDDGSTFGTPNVIGPRVLTMTAIGSAAAFGTVRVCGMWTEVRPSGDTDYLWVNAAISPDGRYQMVTNTANLWRSNDWGQTWTQSDPTGGAEYYGGIAIAYNGNYAWAVAGLGFAWRWNGSSWNQANCPSSNMSQELYYRTVATSYWGDKVLIYASEMYLGYSSSSSAPFSPWTGDPSAGSTNYRTTVWKTPGVCAIQAGSVFYLSTDYLANWRELKPYAGVTNYYQASEGVAYHYSPKGFDMSPDAKHIFTTAGTSNGAYRLWVSHDYGYTWTETRPMGDTTNSWDGQLYISDDGETLLAVAYTSGRIYVSLNGGTSWTEQNPLGDGQSHWYSGAAMDATGSYFLVNVGHYVSGGTNVLGRVYRMEAVSEGNRVWPMNTGIASASAFGSPTILTNNEVLDYYWWEPTIGTDSGYWYINYDHEGYCQSASGQVVYACKYNVNDGGLYKSTDYGVTFSKLSGSGGLPESIYYHAVQCSDDGQVAIAHYGNSSGYLYGTTNGGTSWSQIDLTSGTAFGIYTLGISGDGQVAIVGRPSYTYKTTTGITGTWTDVYSTLSSVYEIAFSYTGQYLIYANNSWGFFISSDYGASKTQKIPGPTANYGELSISYDGSIMYACADYNTTEYGVYRSTNTGSTWSELTIQGQSNYIWDTGLDQDGSIVFASTYGYGHLVSKDSGSTWARIRPTSAPDNGRRSFYVSDDGKHVATSSASNHLWMGREERVIVPNGPHSSMTFGAEPAVNFATGNREKNLYGFDASGPIGVVNMAQDVVIANAGLGDQSVAVGTGGTGDGRVTVIALGTYTTDPTWWLIDNPNVHGDYGVQATRCSSDGEVIVVAGREGYYPHVHISTDGGDSWTESNPTGSSSLYDEWNKPAVSANGSKILIGDAAPGRLWYSSNTGSSWTEKQPLGNIDSAWGKACCNDDGTTYLIGCESAGRLWYSTDTCQTFLETQPLGDTNQSYCGTAMSGNGTYWYAACNSRLYMSSNSGSSWSEVQPAGAVTRTWYALAADYDGSHVVAAAWGYGVYLSTNYGSSWSQVYSTARYWGDAAISADGSRILVVANYFSSTGGRVILSINSGQNWTVEVPYGSETEGSFTYYDYHGCCMDSDGSMLFTGDHGTNGSTGDAYYAQGTSMPERTILATNVKTGEAFGYAEVDHYNKQKQMVGIDDATLFGDVKVNRIMHPEGIESSMTFGNLQTNIKVPVSGIEGYGLNLTEDYNYTFANSTNWTLQSNWTCSSNRLNATAAGSNYLAYTNTITDKTHRLYRYDITTAANTAVRSGHFYIHQTGDTMADGNYEATRLLFHSDGTVSVQVKIDGTFTTVVLQTWTASTTYTVIIDADAATDTINYFKIGDNVYDNNRIGYGFHNAKTSVGPVCFSSYTSTGSGTFTVDNVVLGYYTGNPDQGVGTVKVNQTEYVGSIASEEAFGSVTTVDVPHIYGIPSEEAFGQPTLDVHIIPQGIPSDASISIWLWVHGYMLNPPHFFDDDVFDMDIFDPNTFYDIIFDWNVFDHEVFDIGSLHGIPAGDVFGEITFGEGSGYQVRSLEGEGIASGEAFGTVQLNQTEYMVGLDSLAAFGSVNMKHWVKPTGIATEAAFGSVNMMYPRWFTMTGIVSAAELTTTVFSASTSTSYEGFVRSRNATYSTARSGTGTLGLYTAQSTNYVGEYWTGTYYQLYETFYAWDTSAIGDYDHIYSPVLSFASSSSTVPGYSFQIQVRAFDFGSLDTSDYRSANPSDTPAYDDYTLVAYYTVQNGWTVNNRYNFTTTDDLIAAINRNGYTKFFLIGDNAINGTVPTTTEYAQVAPSTGSYPPRLTLTYGNYGMGHVTIIYPVQNIGHVESGEAFGTVTIRQTKTVVGIGTAAAFGTVNVAYDRIKVMAGFYNPVTVFGSGTRAVNQRYIQVTGIGLLQEYDDELVTVYGTSDTHREVGATDYYTALSGYDDAPQYTTSTHEESTDLYLEVGQEGPANARYVSEAYINFPVATKPATYCYVSNATLSVKGDTDSSTTNFVIEAIAGTNNSLWVTPGSVPNYYNSTVATLDTAAGFSITGYNVFTTIQSEMVKRVGKLSSGGTGVHLVNRNSLNMTPPSSTQMVRFKSVDADAQSAKLDVYYSYKYVNDATWRQSVPRAAGSIGSAAAFGQTIVARDMQTRSPEGIPSAAAFGDIKQRIYATGITSASEMGVVHIESWHELGSAREYTFPKSTVLYGGINTNVLNVTKNELLVLAIATDNTHTSNQADSPTDSVTDADSNTWVKAGEYTQGTSFADGAAVALWYCYVQKANAELDITIDFATGLALCSYEIYRFYPPAYPNRHPSITLYQSSSNGGADNQDPPSMSITGLPTSEVLLLHAAALEMSNNNSATESGWTLWSALGTTGGAAATNMSLRAAHRRVQGSSSYTADMTVTTADHAQVLAGLAGVTTSVVITPDGIASGEAFGDLPLATLQFIHPMMGSLYMEASGNDGTNEVYNQESYGQEYPTPPGTHWEHVRTDTQEYYEDYSDYPPTVHLYYLTRNRTFTGMNNFYIRVGSKKTSDTYYQCWESGITFMGYEIPEEWDKGRCVLTLHQWSSSINRHFDVEISAHPWLYDFTWPDRPFTQTPLGSVSTSALVGGSDVDVELPWSAVAAREGLVLRSKYTRLSGYPPSGNEYIDLWAGVYSYMFGPRMRVEWWSGIPSASAMGAAPRITFSKTMVGIPSAEAFGEVETPNKFLHMVAIDSEEAFGQPTLSFVIPVQGIPSEEHLGTIHLGGALGFIDLVDLGIPAEDAFGEVTVVQTMTMAGIPAEDAFGEVLIGRSVPVASIEFSEAEFGYPWAFVAIHPESIMTEEAIGNDLLFTMTFRGEHNLSWYGDVEGSTYGQDATYPGALAAYDGTADYNGTGRVGQYYNADSDQYTVWQHWLYIPHPLPENASILSARLSCVLTSDSSDTDFVLEAYPTSSLPQWLEPDEIGDPYDAATKYTSSLGYGTSRFYFVSNPGFAKAVENSGSMFVVVSDHNRMETAPTGREYVNLGMSYATWAYQPTLSITFYTNKSIVLPVGIASGEAFGTIERMPPYVLPAGIPAADAFGTVTIVSPRTIVVTGIPSAAAFGTSGAFHTFVQDVEVAGFADPDGFGDARVGYTRILSVSGIPPSWEMGEEPTVTKYDPTYTAPGIPSEERFGDPVVIGGEAPEDDEEVIVDRPLADNFIVNPQFRGTVRDPMNSTRTYQLLRDPHFDNPWGTSWQYSRGPYNCEVSIIPAEDCPVRPPEGEDYVMKWHFGASPTEQRTWVVPVPAITQWEMALGMALETSFWVYLDYPYDETWCVDIGVVPFAESISDRLYSLSFDSRNDHGHQEYGAFVRSYGWQLYRNSPYLDLDDPNFNYPTQDLYQTPMTFDPHNPIPEFEMINKDTTYLAGIIGMCERPNTDVYLSCPSLWTLSNQQVIQDMTNDLQYTYCFDGNDDGCSWIGGDENEHKVASYRDIYVPRPTRKLLVPEGGTQWANMEGTELPSTSATYELRNLAITWGSEKVMVIPERVTQTKLPFPKNVDSALSLTFPTDYACYNFSMIDIGLSPDTTLKNDTAYTFSVYIHAEGVPSEDMWYWVELRLKGNSGTYVYDTVKVNLAESESHWIRASITVDTPPTGSWLFRWTHGPVLEDIPDFGDGDGGDMMTVFLGGPMLEEVSWSDDRVYQRAGIYEAMADNVLGLRYSHYDGQYHWDPVTYAIKAGRYRDGYTEGMAWRDHDDNSSSYSLADYTVAYDEVPDELEEPEYDLNGWVILEGSDFGVPKHNIPVHSSLDGFKDVQGTVALNELREMNLKIRIRGSSFEDLQDEIATFQRMVTRDTWKFRLKRHPQATVSDTYRVLRCSPVKIPHTHKAMTHFIVETDLKLWVRPNDLLH